MMPAARTNYPSIREVTPGARCAAIPNRGTECPYCGQKLTLIERLPGGREWWACIPCAGRAFCECGSAIDPRRMAALVRHNLHICCRECAEAADKRRRPEIEDADLVESGVVWREVASRA